MNPPPAGWYQDPEGPPGQTRWWDGQRWTEQRAAPPLAKPQWTTAAPKGDGPWRRFRASPSWAQAAAWVTVGLVLIAALALGDEDPGSTSGTDTGQATTSPKKAQRPTADAVADAAVVCGASSRRKFSADFELETTAPQALATRYARGYDASVRPTVYAACLKAIRARPARLAASARRTRVRQARARRAQQVRAQAAQTRKLKQQQAAEAERRRREAAAARRQDEENQQSNCQPGYSPCLKPDAGDYDCDGGSGDGPHYTGPVSVSGEDVFDLDRDGDGSGCDT